MYLYILAIWYHVVMRKRVCIGCGHEGGIYDFSPSIEIAKDDFRIFHAYNKMNGHLYCIECKKRHLIRISKYKKLIPEQVKFIQKSLKSESDWNKKENK